MVWDQSGDGRSSVSEPDGDGKQLRPSQHVASGLANYQNRVSSASMQVTTKSMEITSDKYSTSHTTIGAENVALQAIEIVALYGDSRVL